MKHAVGVAVALSLFLSLGGSGTLASPDVLVRVDFDAWREHMLRSHVGQWWQEPEVVRWRVGTVRPVFAALEAGTGISQERLTSHLTGRANLTLDLGALAQSTNAPSGFVLGVHQPGRIDDLLSLLGGLCRTEEERSEFEALTHRVGRDIAFLAPDRAFLAEALAFAGERQAQLPNPHLEIHVLPGAVLDTARAEGTLTPEAEKVLSHLGLDGLSAVVHERAGMGEGSITRTELSFDGPRRGVFALVGPNREFRTLALVPPDSVQVGVTSLPSAVELFDFIVSVAALSGDQRVPLMFQRGLLTFRETVGMDLRDELLPALGQELCVVSGGLSPGSLNIGLIVEMKDPDTFARFIQGVVAAGAQAGAGQGSGVRAIDMTWGTQTYQMIVIPGLPFRVCVAMVGDHLVLTMSTPQMQSIISAAESGQSIADVSEFRSLIEALPAPAAALQWVDVKRQTAVEWQIAQLSLAQVSLPPEMTGVLQQITTILPTTFPHIGQRASVLVAEPTRLVVTGLDSTGMSVSWAGVGVAAAVAVPALLEARENALIQANQGSQVGPGGAAP